MNKVIMGRSDLDDWIVDHMDDEGSANDAVAARALLLEKAHSLKLEYGTDWGPFLADEGRKVLKGMTDRKKVEPPKEEPPKEESKTPDF